MARNGWAGACALIVLAASIAGCAGVETEPPRPTIGLDPDDRYAAADPAAPTPRPSDLRWWRRFDDTRLTEWVERALAAAPDIGIARERVAQAQAQLRSARAQRSPTLEAEASAGYNTRPSGGERRARLTGGLLFAWDADLWGGLQQAERSAAAELLRSHDLVQATRLAIAALASRGVIEYREAVRDMQLLAQAHALQADVLRVVQIRFDAGLAPRLDVERARADMAAIEADQASAAARTRQAFAALQLLAGERPQPPSLQTVTVSAQAPSQGAALLPALEGEQPVGRPLDLLRQRPDLRAAQRALEAAAADIGVARAALRPRLRLPGTLALVSGALSGGVIETVSAGIAAVIDVAERIDFRRSEWFAEIPAGVRFELIVANPPYLSGAEVAAAPLEVRGFEPAGALVAAADGIADLRAILASAPGFLAAGGLLALETGTGHHAELLALAQQAGFTRAESRRDLTGRDRIVLAYV